MGNQAEAFETAFCHDWRRLIGRCVTVRKAGDLMDGCNGVILYPLLPNEPGGGKDRYSVMFAGVVRCNFNLTDLEVRQ